MASPNEVNHANEFTVIFVRDVDGLTAHEAAWEALVPDAIEPNVFYEPWMLIPALRAFGPGPDLRIVFVYAPDPARPDGPSLLCGVFPLQRQSRWKGLPAPALSFLTHKYCFLTIPLIRTVVAKQTLAALFKWLTTSPEGTPLLEFTLIAGEGSFHRLLVDEMYTGGRLSFVSDCYTRAFMKMHSGADAYLQASIKGDRRREIRRRERLLSEQGEVKYAALQNEDDPEAWLREFLRIEAAGWKGREGTALACRKEDEQYFLNIAREGHRRGRLLMHALHVGISPVAFNCYFRAGSGCYYFKPTFREEYAQFGPGRLLEVETIRRLHSMPELQWADSCTAPDNELLNSLWMERRTIMSLCVSTGRTPGDLVVSLSPALRWIKQKLRRGDNHVNRERGL